MKLLKKIIPVRAGLRRMYCITNEKQKEKLCINRTILRSIPNTVILAIHYLDSGIYQKRLLRRFKYL